MHHLTYLFAGLDGHNTIARWMTLSAVTALVSLALLLIPDVERKNPSWLWPVSACFCHSGSRKD